MLNVQVLPMDKQLHFCREHRLPVNDSWLVPTVNAADKVRACLDNLASSAVPTAEAIAALDATVSASVPDKVLRVPGTYPHEQWQGTRIEGFVVSQGPSINKTFAENIGNAASELEGQRINISRLEPPLVRPASSLLGHMADTDDAKEKVKEEVPHLAFLMVLFSCNNLFQFVAIATQSMHPWLSNAVGSVAIGGIAM
jgi:hypothetical protein